MGGNWWQWEDTTKPKAYEWEYEKAEKEAQQRKSWLDLLPGFGGEEPTLQAGAPHPILAGMEWWGEQQRNLAAASMEQQRIEQGLQRGEVLEPKSWAEALRQYAETPEPGMPPFGRLAATELGMHLAAAEQGEPYQMPPVSTMPREAFPVKGFTEMLADPLWATTFLPWGGLEALPAVARGLGAAGRRVAPAVSQAARRAAPVAREMAESEVTGFARMMGQEAARGQAEFARLPKAAPTGAAKEAWQMTRAEYLKEKRHWIKETLPLIMAHKSEVELAVKQGKPVPAEVLKDYPYLAGVEL